VSVRVEVGRCTLPLPVLSALPWPVTSGSRDDLAAHTYGRGKDTHIMVPGRPYSLITALETAAARGSCRWISAG
jgi:hypothetical protein